MKEFQCTNCEQKTEISRFISFVDTPGHHSYVGAMARGGAVMDGAIIVTDVRATELQPQTIEHLIILEMLGIRNLLVVQNKVDLSTPHNCISNYRMLRSELSLSVAENAPIIPLSAQQGKNIQRLVDYIYQMTEPSRLRTNNPGIMSVIRSFDVNKPGTVVEKIQGGVLGVVTIGPVEYKVGDTIEIRPNPKQGSSTEPLMAKITSIHVENEQRDQIERGCLHGIGTTLDPLLTKADGLVGCVAGFSQYLPNPTNKLTVRVKRIKSSKELVEKGGLYIILVGTTKATVRAIEHVDTSDKGLDKKAWVFCCKEPLCLTTDRCLIYTSKMELLGVGLMGTTVDEHHIDHIESDYENELSLFPMSEELSYGKEKVPVLRLGRENRNAVWLNGQEFSRYIGKELEDICCYLQVELVTSVRICPGGVVRFYKHRLTEGKLQSVISNYLKSISCDQCKSIFTQPEGKMLKCKRCGAIVAKQK